MRKITQQAIEAFYSNKSFKSGNTRVTIEDGNSYLLLHGCPIAKRVNGTVSINPHGYTTTTTSATIAAIATGLINDLKSNFFKSPCMLHGENTMFKPIR